MTSHNDLFVALRQITRAIDLNSKRLSKTTGMTASQLLILQTLLEEGGMSKPSIVAKRIHLSQATVTSIVDRLARAGLVTRAKSETDRRAVNIVLTEAGRRRLESAPEALQESFRTAFDRLEQWEQSLLVSSVQRLAAMMNAEELDAAAILEIGTLTDPG